MLFYTVCFVDLFDITVLYDRNELFMEKSHYKVLIFSRGS